MLFALFTLFSSSLELFSSSLTDLLYLFCDLREWRNLELVQPPSKRKKVAIGWLKFNHRQCGYGAQIYVRNTMARTLGTAHQIDVEMLTWELIAPQAEKTQAVKQKRRL